MQVQRDLIYRRRHYNNDPSKKAKRTFKRSDIAVATGKLQGLPNNGCDFVFSEEDFNSKLEDRTRQIEDFLPVTTKLEDLEGAYEDALAEIEQEENEVRHYNENFNEDEFSMLIGDGNEMNIADGHSGIKSKRPTPSPKRRRLKSKIKCASFTTQSKVSFDV